MYAVFHILQDNPIYVFDNVLEAENCAQELGDKYHDHRYYVRDVDID